MITVLFIPGFQEDLNSRDYARPITAIREAGYAVEFVPVAWKRTTIDEWLPEFERTYAAYDPKETVLAGFSYGAMVAFLAAAKRPPASLWLFSLSPYFAEDLPRIRESWLRYIGKRRVAAFSRLSFAELAPQITAPTLVFVGEQELEKWPEMRLRPTEAARLIPDSRLFVVPDTGHAVDEPAYAEAIATAIRG